MHTRTRLSLGFIGLMLPVLALAAPGNVMGIRAETTNEGVRVSWTPPAGDVASYRVYYSASSILNNGGLYDDFEMVAGSELSHVLRNVPAVSDLYVSVLAVDSKGNESAYFVEEAHVTLSPSAVTTSSMMMVASSAPASSAPQAMSMPTAMPSSIPAAQEDTLRLLSAEAVSSTGVLLRFSLPVVISPDQASGAIILETGSGVRLMMKRFVIQGNDILVHTVTQERGIVYRAKIGLGVMATGSKGQRLAVSADEAPLLFMGHVTGKTPSSPSSQQTSTGPIVRTEVTMLRLRAQPEEKAYRVDVTWQAPTGSAFTAYSVAQTTDNGKSYSTPQTLSKAATAITVRNVPGGNFGVLVKTVYADGSMSRGILQTINLPKTGGTTGSVTGGSTTLPNSGPALWVALLGISSYAGYRQVRRAQLKRAVA